MRWNDIDDEPGVAASISARSLTGTVTKVEDLGGGNGRITVSLRDANGRPYVSAANDEAVLDIMLADTVVSPESALARFGGIIDATGIICSGGGTAHVQVVAEESEVTIEVTTTAARPKDVYVLLAQGQGSTYIIRSGQRWAKLTLGVY